MFQIIIQTKVIIGVMNIMKDVKELGLFILKFLKEQSMWMVKLTLNAGNYNHPS